MAQQTIKHAESEFLNFEGAQESIPMNQFRQPMWPGGPVQQPFLQYIYDSWAH